MSLLFRRAILVAYLCFITILFCLPGSAFPKQSWLDQIWFDKWVHIGLFFILCYTVCWVWNGRDKKFYLKVFCAAVLYGILIEVIQDQAIPNRSFDIGDWVADIIGSITGLYTWQLRNKKVYKK
jgi:VanZ family protein